MKNWDKKREHVPLLLQREPQEMVAKAAGSPALFLNWRCSKHSALSNGLVCKRSMWLEAHMQTESLQGFITWPLPVLFFFRKTATGVVVPWHPNDLYAKFHNFAQQHGEVKACQQNSCKIHLLQSNIFFVNVIFRNVQPNFAETLL